MSVTKHKIFKINIIDDGKFTLAKTIESSINEFLMDPNIVYVNHSVTTLTEDVEEYDSFKTICKFVFVSLIYKDLKETPMNATNISKKTKQLIHKEVEDNAQIKEPEIFTDLDKLISDFQKL
ncbi:hypothetical protein LUD75_08365 [Epilithonimonas sp. JDS]|uniref:hypothetical protein n=1 Tax=Epilithonimonas sp. JDS TaxID=2902797 RepID=UPI001E3DB4F8|nr:hypothetical protein [Epilithonimonas sp. JDS]MCD9854718.1 hypothetical protein [Epilithonimonas sp. JDS]